jgi:biopolymer transport protein ExbB
MAWYNPSWLYRLPVTVNNTANATSALAYHQVGVALTGAAATSFRTHAKADGSDAVVTDSDELTPLKFALEGIDTANNAVYLLIKVPVVAAAATRTIYVYYGNAAATSTSSYATTVGPTTALVGPTDVYTQAESRR